MAAPHPFGSSLANPALARRIGRPRTVLDLGCGSGANGHIAKGLGAHVTGVESEPELAASAERSLDAVLLASSRSPGALEALLGDSVFDLVLIPSWLERSEQPQALVELAARRLGPEGRLMYAVATESGWRRRLQLDDAARGRRRAHFHDRAAAETWARAAGLELLESGAGLASDLLADEQVIVARKKPLPGPLSLTVGMLSMDEEPSMAKMIDAIRAQAPDAKILCVDSSRKDQTPIIAERMGARVLRQLPPRGHGPAMELLMYEAATESEALIYLDCDFTYPADYIPQIRRILELGVDVVNGARTRSRPAAMPLANFAANRAFVLCARALDGIAVGDLHSGMRGYRASTIRNFDFDGSGDALPIDTLLWPARSGYHVVEIPIDYHERVGASKLRKLAGTTWTFIRLARTLRVGSRRHSRYDVWPTSERTP